MIAVDIATYPEYITKLYNLVHQGYTVNIKEDIIENPGEFDNLYEVNLPASEVRKILSSYIHR